MELPTDLAALVAALQDQGFTVKKEEWHPWPGGGWFELAAPARRRGVKRVRMIEDRGMWDVEVRLGGDWYEPVTALLALDDTPHEQWALSHEQRHAATLQLARRFTGDRRQLRKIKRRAKGLSEAYTRWAEGKSPTNPYG